MTNTPKKSATSEDTQRSHLKLVASQEANEGESSELVSLFATFEDALMKEIEAILNL